MANYTHCTLQPHLQCKLSHSARPNVSSQLKRSRHAGKVSSRSEKEVCGEPNKPKLESPNAPHRRHRAAIRTRQQARPKTARQRDRAPPQHPVAKLRQVRKHWRNLSASASSTYASWTATSTAARPVQTGTATAAGCKLERHRLPPGGGFPKLQRCFDPSPIFFLLGGKR